ncbi:hypothetical protein [Gayadomonas joobiniege]|uniref:hypothetical protein n=1 Tax=Gayadomonas joobiniege TaxID=1234606 RepID=UPI00035FCD6F|nr:hypothetical protein [Gayadomonas joobiniege]
MKTVSKGVCCLFAAIVAAGCSMTPQVNNDSSTSDDRENYLYLRGNFTWWDIEEHAKVKHVEGNTYKSTVELIADGQPYEFKFADENWSLGANCGYLEKAEQVVTIGSKSTANCKAKFEPFIFVPKKTGEYDFFIDFDNPETPEIWIEPAEPGLFDSLVPTL